jgi:hypothetical protein
MKTILNYSLILILLQFFVTGNYYIQKASLAQNGFPGDNSSPYSFIKSTADPYVLPNDAGGRTYNTELQGFKLLAIDWKISQYCINKSKLLNSVHSPVSRADAETTSRYILNCILRL